MNGIEKCSQSLSVYSITSAQVYMYYLLFFSQIWGRREIEASEGRRTFYKCIQMQEGSNVEST